MQKIKQGDTQNKKKSIELLFTIFHDDKMTFRGLSFFSLLLNMQISEFPFFIRLNLWGSDDKAIEPGHKISIEVKCYSSFFLSRGRFLARDKFLWGKAGERIFFLPVKSKVDLVIVLV